MGVEAYNFNQYAKKRRPHLLIVCCYSFIIITMMKLSRCVLDSIFHQTNKKLVDSIFLAVLGIVCLQNEELLSPDQP